LCVGVIFPALILLGGVYFSFRLRFFSLFHPLRFLRSLRDGEGSLRSLNLALAGTLGVGNIVGVVNALRLGGAGAVLWMAISALFCANLKYAEAYLASFTRKRNERGCYGGAYVYIERAFGRLGRVLAVVFAVCFAVSSLSTGGALQAGAVTEAVSFLLPSVPSVLVSLLLGGMVLVSSLGGLSRISDITNRLVPVMTGVYVIITLAVIAVNAKALPSVVWEIFSSAFKREGVLFGIGGFCFTECMRCGIMRGLLSNEAGCGSSASAHATEDNSSPHRQGCLGIAEVYADTVIMCTLTALAVLLSGADFTSGGDIELTVSAYGAVGGVLFSSLTVICIAVFGYATLICFAGYGRECVGYIFKNEMERTKFSVLFLFIYVLIIVLSPFIDGESVLLCADISMGVMAAVNIPAMVRLWRREHITPMREGLAGWLSHPTDK